MSTPPIAPRKTHTTTVHGRTFHDEYYWLRERDNPAVHDYLAAENAYVQASISADTQAVLRAELYARIVGDDDSAAAVIGEHAYFLRYQDESDYPVIMRRAVSSGQEHVVCDIQREAQGLAFLKLGEWSVSPDGQYIAMLFDNSGNEHFSLHLRRIADGQPMITPVPNLYYGLAWSPDSHILYLVQPDAAWRPSRVLGWHWQQPFETAQLLFAEPNELCNVELQSSADDAHILIGSHSSTSSEVWIYDAATMNRRECVQPRREHIEYAVGMMADQLYMQTNDHAVNFCVQTRTLGQTEWSPYIAHRTDIVIERLMVFADHVVLWVRHGGLPQVEVYDRHTRAMHQVAFADATYAVSPWWHQHYRSAVVRMVYTTPITPATTYDYDMQTRAFTIVKQDRVGGRPHHPADYHLERVNATASDGTLVPLTIVRHRSVVCDGSAPALLIGYGSYGVNLGVNFSAERLSLLERGFVLAFAHIRGGGEMGREWYLHGKLLHKQNTFSDFICCAEYLIAQRYTQSSRLACFGRSAGGLLMGAVVTQRPELFAACIAGVPFVDVINTMLDSSIPLTVPEYEEWGNPHDPQFFAYMLAYSPYDNTRVANYPAILMTAGFNDPRVQYWEPTKWIAKLRHLTPDGRYYLATDMMAGHAGKSGRYDAVQDRALEYAFLCDILNVPVGLTTT
jgi:oligopeptidase B